MKTTGAWLHPAYRRQGFRLGGSLNIKSGKIKGAAKTQGLGGGARNEWQARLDVDFGVRTSWSPKPASASTENMPGIQSPRLPHTCLSEALKEWLFSCPRCCWRMGCSRPGQYACPSANHLASLGNRRSDSLLGFTEGSLNL